MIVFMTLAMMTFNDDDNDDDIQGSVSHLASLQFFAVKIFTPDLNILR